MMPFPPGVPPDPRRDAWQTTYEKAAVQLSLFQEMEDIRYKLAALSREWQELPRRFLNEKMLEVEELVEHMLHRSVALGEPRGVPVWEMLKAAPELTIDPTPKNHLGVPKTSSYIPWREYILAWLKIVFEMLDRANLLLTDVLYEPEPGHWADSFFAECMEEGA